MRIYLKHGMTEAEIAHMKEEGNLPETLSVKVDSETGRKYFNYLFRRHSGHVIWSPIFQYIGACSNLVITYCDLVPEGIYEDTDRGMNIRAIVILKRNQASGVTWEEIEFYSERTIPDLIGEAYGRFREGKFRLVTKWSSGIPHRERGQ